MFQAKIKQREPKFKCYLVSNDNVNKDNPKVNAVAYILMGYQGKSKKQTAQKLTAR